MNYRVESLMKKNSIRFKVVHREGSLNWLLQIKFLQNRDSGVYECQVNTFSAVLEILIAVGIPPRIFH